MAAFDIFNNDAFSLSNLTLAMQDLQYTPTMIADMGLFNEQGISTTSVMIEQIGQKFELVAAKERGSSNGLVVGKDRRSMRNFSTIHLPQRGAVNADEVQGVRAFGSMTDVQMMQDIVNAKLTKMRRNIDLTMEWQRLGAIKGQILDADAATVLLDMYDAFDVMQPALAFDLDVDETKVKQKCLDLERTIEDALDGIVSSGTTVLCSKEFFDALVQHPAVEAAFNFWQSQMKSESQRKSGFEFCNVFFKEYRGKVGSTRFVASGEAYAIPTGVPDLFITRFAPADYDDTVNTVGLPYYAKQELMRFGKGVELEAQSNPLHLCTRPAAVVKLTLT